MDPAPKIFLQNKLTRSRSKLQELGPLLETKSMSSNIITYLVLTTSALQDVKYSNSPGYLMRTKQKNLWGTSMIYLR